MNQIPIAERKDGSVILRNQVELSGRQRTRTLEQLLQEDLTEDSREKIISLINNK